jgi:hypothetical protein
VAEAACRCPPAAEVRKDLAQVHVLGAVARDDEHLSLGRKEKETEKNITILHLERALDDGAEALGILLELEVAGLYDVASDGSPLEAVQNFVEEDDLLPFPERRYEVLHELERGSLGEEIPGDVEVLAADVRVREITGVRVDTREGYRCVLRGNVRAASNQRKSELGRVRAERPLVHRGPGYVIAVRGMMIEDFYLGGERTTVEVLGNAIGAPRVDHHHSFDLLALEL